MEEARQYTAVTTRHLGTVYRSLMWASFGVLLATVVMAIVGARHGAGLFIVWMALIYSGAVINLLSGLKSNTVFQLSNDVSKEARPVRFGFLLGVNMLMVVGVTLAMILVMMTRNW